MEAALHSSGGQLPNKRFLRRVSRAIHDILYDPSMGVTQDSLSTAWRVDKVEVSQRAHVTVWWVPSSEIDVALSLDNVRVRP
jgi:hypothetical protein